MNIEYTPENLRQQLQEVGFPAEGKMSSKQVVEFLKEQGINFELDNFDKSIPCSSSISSEVKNIIQVYRLFDDNSVVRIALDENGEVLCVSRLGQHRGL